MMPSLKSLVVALAPLAGLVQSAPTAEHTEMLAKRAVDLVSICEDFRPAPDELGILATSGVRPAWSGKNLGIEGTGKVAILYDSECVVQGETTWEPQNPAFEMKMGRYFNGVGPEPSQQINIWARTGYIGGSFGVAPISVKINDVQMVMNCADDQSSLDGLTADYYRSCNFQHQGLWPWAPGSGA